MSSKELKHLTPKEASRMLIDNPRAVLVDVRSTTEYLLVGHPLGAVHIPWIDEPDWVIDKHFVTNV
ncbi:MAG: rhodanese-like domain-containing protein, partial [Spirochaetia bacterium]|nr:rhodanese-like domain-containing protein [Spirochaetia bacterium]